MTQVVDASVVVSLLLDTGPTGRWCEREIAVEDLAAPALMPYEAANIIRRTLARGAIDLSLAHQAITDLEVLPVDLVPYSAVSTRAWDLRSNLTSYDASYVAVAELVGGRLLTLDARLAVAYGPKCPIAVAPDD